MQLIYLADTFKDNYNILHAHFETGSVNVMKYMSLDTGNKGNLNILAWLSLLENHENCH